LHLGFAVETCTADSIANIRVDGASIASWRVVKPARFSKALEINLNSSVPFADETGVLWN